jgi:hypothetical protein
MLHRFFSADETVIPVFETLLDCKSAISIAVAKLSFFEGMTQQCLYPVLASAPIQGERDLREDISIASICSAGGVHTSLVHLERFFSHDALCRLFLTSIV